MNTKINRTQPIRGLTEGAPSQNPKRRSDLNCRIIDGETVILDLKEGHLHQLNPTASFIWDCCDGNLRMDQIVDRLASAYEVDSTRARKDVEEVVAKLQSSNLLEADWNER